MARRMLTMILLGILVVIFCECGKDKEEKQARTGKDGAEIVLIPAGEFQMGSSDGLDGEKPIHKVYLDAFYMAKYEVTNAQYKEFMDATGHKASLSWNESKFNTPNHPVLGVY